MLNLQGWRCSQQTFWWMMLGKVFLNKWIPILVHLSRYNHIFQSSSFSDIPWLSWGFGIMKSWINLNSQLKKSFSLAWNLTKMLCCDFLFFQISKSESSLLAREVTMAQVSCLIVAGEIEINYKNFGMSGQRSSWLALRRLTSNNLGGHYFQHYWHGRSAFQSVDKKLS